MTEKTLEKLQILADAAKYDVSCASSGSKRKNTKNGLGNATGLGICHSYTEDGRCVSLLKILLTNHCIFDCAYCVSRKSNDIKRAAFSVEEVVDITLNFYRRNYIEGLFLSSGIFKNADYTMERLVRIAKELRRNHNFNGYIHLKAIPGASDELLHEAGLYADRLSVNIEIPSEMSLKKVAPEKNYKDVLEPMTFLRNQIKGYKKEKAVIKSTPKFSPGGQSTQLVVGATPENDLQILKLSDGLYKDKQLKRVYYSGYIPISRDERVPDLIKPPLIRENRLYQADWLMRFYGYKWNEIVDVNHPDLDLEIDPKFAFALRNPHIFPVDINTAPRELILRVPGIGVKSVNKILAARKFGNLREENLKKIGVVWKRAQYFVYFPNTSTSLLNLSPEVIRKNVMGKSAEEGKLQQLSLFTS